ncbi:hypothetical protein IQ230_00035 [Gloeocapsopsis crepidinum LEGE 06123]|uniref:Uncharacterized protein n=1 Tax=Gloeocapsopsis crepidinum LEGE 06123 TaxID=588587 RepID=A0ABR9UKG3_9CHRO|nr:hypothetical protein [Gloeocapsopsis crepidinum]MBE9188781.1 hypothetical protein [Gloeocapsopsis crepidinum LEGE 06123]
MEFWIDDCSNGTRLTDVAPRGKWNRLINVRIVYFELPPEWEQQLAKSKKEATYSSQNKIKNTGITLY